ncbi:UbiA prenyltransferase family protein [Nonlabens xiamenensis]|uniref:hypothetical protein n=1 Tax=Nonlabens xiamenensis TaxID=2341043 RepID=UPI000F611614|nr:hypothetical protein [Nonlabens xiamenensis]
MGFLKHILDFYLRSSLHVALCFVALFLICNQDRYSPVGIEVPLLLFCGALLGYNLIKYGRLVLDGSQFRYRLPILLLSVMAVVVAGYLFLEESFEAQLILLGSALLGVLYAFPLPRHRNFRQVPWIKLVIVALAWSLLIICYPNFSTHGEMSSTTGGEVSSLWMSLVDFIQLMLLVMALCIPFEIRDLKYDAPQLRTVPQVIGTRNAKILGVAWCVLYIVIEYFQLGWPSDVEHQLTYLMLGVIALAIWRADQFKSDYYASFFVEAIPALWWLLIHLNQ